MLYYPADPCRDESKRVVACLRSTGHDSSWLTGRSLSLRMRGYSNGFYRQKPSSSANGSWPLPLTGWLNLNIPNTILHDAVQCVTHVPYSCLFCVERPPTHIDFPI